MRLLFLVLALTASGCFEVHRRDERTIVGVRQTLDARVRDHDRWQQALRAPSTEVDLRGIQALQDAEVLRLRAWLTYEESKGE